MSFGSLRRAGLNLLRSLDPPQPVVHYKHKLPGNLVHFDIKRLAHLHKPSHRVTGERRKKSRGIGWEYLHVAIDGHRRIDFTAILPDQSHQFCATLLSDRSAEQLTEGRTSSTGSNCGSGTGLAPRSRRR